jgi:hypothetical protein
LGVLFVFLVVFVQDMSGTAKVFKHYHYY